MLATRDPRLIEQIGLELSTVHALEHDGRVPLGGRWYGALDIGAAWSLASCSFGADCGPTNDLVIRRCAFFGECLSSLQDVTREAYVRENGDVAWSSVLEAAGLIADAVGRADASAFFAPRRTSERRAASKQARRSYRIEYATTDDMPLIGSISGNSGASSP